MADFNGNGDAHQRWQLQLPTVTEMAMADHEGIVGSNG
jgi:hypothetical protein